MKLINIKVITNAKRNSVVTENDRFKVYVTAPAVDGKANKAVIDVLAGFFKVKKNSIKIIRGERAREKVIEVVL